MSFLAENRVCLLVFIGAT